MVGADYLFGDYKSEWIGRVEQLIKESLSKPVLLSSGLRKHEILPGYLKVKTDTVVCGDAISVH